MTLPAELLEQLVDEFAERVAARIALPSAAPAEPWRLLDVEEAAERLGRSSRWIRERVKRGALPYVKLDGGALAFEENDLRAFADARRVAADRLAVSAVRVQASQASPRSRTASAIAGLSNGADPVSNRRVR